MVISLKSIEFSNFEEAYYWLVLKKWGKISLAPRKFTSRVRFPWRDGSGFAAGIIQSSNLTAIVMVIAIIGMAGA